ncbi:MAG: 50S ribosomal protein L10 [Candidatus Dadabacteria bacterium]|nr:MAG: 50S ribosomal protein L10 [Candidatus Dadabacteria bacterium]
MNREQKAQLIDELQQRLSQAAGVFLTDFTGLSVAETQQLRGQLREAGGVQFTVVKNTLLKRSLEGTPFADALEEMLVGPNAVVLADDVVAAAKALVNFLKESDSSLKIKGGALGSDVLTAEQVEALSKMASREELIAKFVGLLQTPLRNFATVLQAPLRDIASVLRQLEQQKSEAS